MKVIAITFTLFVASSGAGAQQVMSPGATPHLERATELRMRITQPTGENIVTGLLREAEDPRALGSTSACLAEQTRLWLSPDTKPAGPHGESIDVLMLSMGRRGDVAVFRIDVVSISCDALNDEERVAAAPQYRILEDTLKQGDSRLVREVEAWGLAPLRIAVDEVERTPGRCPTSNSTPVRRHG